MLPFNEPERHLLEVQPILINKAVWTESWYYSLRADGRTDRRDRANSRFSPFS
jgi:hypothetical protein